MPQEFRRDASAVLADFKRALNDVLADLGTRRPVDLQRLLHLDLTLSWQLFKVAGESNPLAAGASMPSKANVAKFAKGAAAQGVSDDRLAILAAVYDRFERVVDCHAGDRTNFISLVTAASGLSDEWQAADLQHRRHMFRGMSHVLCVQAQTRSFCYVLAPNPAHPTHPFQFLSLNTHVNLRVLREIDRVRVHNARVNGAKKGRAAETAVPQRVPVPGLAEGSLVTEFCSSPLPEVRVDHGKLRGSEWFETSFIRPQVGKLGMMTAVCAEHVYFRAGPTLISHTTTLPCEVLMLDVLVPPGLYKDRPTLELYTGERNPDGRAPDDRPIPGTHRLDQLGPGLDALATSDVPRYVDMVRTLTNRVGLNVEGHEIWRLRLEYPIYQCSADVVLMPHKVKAARRKKHG